MNKAEVLLRKHSPTILTVLGSAGVVATTVLAVKATPKAMKLIEEEKMARREYTTIFADNQSYETVVFPDLTPLEVVKIAWKPYVPAAITGLSTIFCILGINFLNTRRQASLMSAYALLDNSYKEYRKFVDELYGEKSDKKVVQEIVNENVDKELVSDDDDVVTFFDFESMRSFESTFEEVKEAERVFIENFIKSGFACLNDFYALLGLLPVEYGYQLGWSALSGYDPKELAFEYEKTVMDDGFECYIITMPTSPCVDYFY